MLPRLRSARVINLKNTLNDCKNISCCIQRRCRNTESTINPELAYMHNPGKNPLIETTVGKLLESAAENWPNRDCVISLHQNLRITYSEVLKRADKLAAGLKKIGLKKGDRIGIWGPNELQWFLAYMACARAGLIVAGINPSYTLREVEYSINKIGARAVIAPATFRYQNYAEMLLEIKKRSAVLEHIIIHSDDHVTGTRRFTDVENLAGRKDVEAVKEEQVEISPYCGTNIQFTSGTTGNPKATLLAHRSLVNNSKQIQERLQLHGKKVCLNVPYFHAFGMVQGVVGPLHSGTSVVLENPTFNPVKSIEAIKKEKCNATFGTPTMWANMIDVQNRTRVEIDSLEIGCTGGAPASPQLFKRIRESLRMERIKTIFGLTETTAAVNQSLPDEDPELTNTTVGYISDHMEIKVIDENGNIVPFGSPGELCVKGYANMIGYWGDEENTKKSVEDGWLKSGDQYILRKDGYGIIVGRLKDMLIRGGENIFPKEIEHFLETNPSIVEVHAFGVHDDIYGEEICACIKLKNGAKLKEEDVVNYCKGKIAKFKIPRYIVFRDEFPKTSSGKIQKFKLKKELEEQSIVPSKPND